jgi:excisionase family DNA binding protein
VLCVLGGQKYFSVSHLHTWNPRPLCTDERRRHDRDQRVPSENAHQKRRLDSKIVCMDRDISVQQLKQTLEANHRALEELESALLEFEETIFDESQQRPEERRGLELLSIPELCQELGMGKSWIYRRIRSGEIPSVRLGRTIKVKRSDLEEYLESRRHRPLSQ